MVSDFLKKKAREEAARITAEQGENAYGGTKWLEQNTGIKTEGGQMPSSAQEKKTTTQPEKTVKISTFLQKKAQEQAARITEAYGEDAYGGSKWLKEGIGIPAQERKPLTMQGLGIPGYNEKDAGTGWNKFLSDQKQKQNKQENKSWFEKAARWIGNSPDSTLPVANLTTVSKSYADDTSYREPTDKWSEQQRKNFGFLYLTDPEKAWKYAEELNNSIAGAEKETQLTEIQKAATGGFWKGAAHTAGALATAPLGLADYLNYLAESSARGKITENESVTPFEYSQAVSGGISQNLNEQYGTLNEKIPVIGGKGLGDVYSLGTSIVQSAAAGYSGGQFGTLIQFFGSAAASGVVDAKQRGATDKQALAIGTLEGIAEGLAEMIGVDNLLHIGSSATMRELVTNLALQGVSEGLEEGVTTVLNGFADQLVMQDKSHFNTLVRKYTENGMPVNDAKMRAWLDMANDLAFDMLGGFVSGAVHAGPQTAYETYRMNRIGKNFAQLNLDKADVQGLIDSGLESAPETESYQIAQEIQKQIDEGKTPSNYDLARLWQANQQAIADEKVEQAEGAGVMPNGQSVTGQAQNVTEGQQNVPRAPLSIAEQIRLEKLNQGGIINGTGQFTGTGAGVLSGSSQRADGAGTGEPAGSMAGRAGQAAQRQKLAERNAAAVSRINRLGSLRLPRISSSELGLKSGTEAKNIRLVPQEHWDPEMEQLAERIYQETGKTVSYVTGRIQVRGKDGRVRNVKGVTYDDKIVVRADHTQFSMEQIADHEAYHGRVDFFGDRLNQEIRRHITENFSQEEFEAVVTKYVEALAGVYDTGENVTEEEYEALMRQVQEEVFADAYAGINAFGAGADRFTSAVNEKMEQLGLGRYQAEEQANGVRETAGPPADIPGPKENTAEYGGEKYSIDERFESMIDSWDGNTIGFSFVVGETSDALQEAGVPKKQIRWDASKIKTLLAKHNGMTLETVKQIPELLEHPIIVIDSKKGANSKIVMGDLYDEHGKIVTAVLLLTPTSKKGNVLDILKISSAEGRSHIKSLFTAENGSTVPVRYVDKKRIQSWLNVNRLQLPLHNLDSDSDIIINDPSSAVKNQQKDIFDMTDEEFQERYGLKLRAVDEVENGPDSQTFGEKRGKADGKELFSLDDSQHVEEYGISHVMTDSEISAVQNVGRKSVNSFNSADVKAAERLAQQYWKEMGTKSPFFRAWFGDWRVNDQTPIQVANQRGDTRGIQHNEDTGWEINVSGQVFNETNNHRSVANRSARQYLPWINDIVRDAVLLDSFGLETGKAKSNNSLLMHSLYAVADIGNGPEVLKLYVEEMNSPGMDHTAKRAYQLQNIEKAFGASVRVQGNTPSSLTNTSNTIKTVADLFAAVKRLDVSFAPNPVSKVLNDDGTPKVVYHGSYKNFSIFDGKARKHSGAPDDSHFFTDNEDVGYSYTGYKEIAKPGSNTYKGGIYPVYLNIRDPLVINFGGQHWSEKLNGRNVNEWAQYAMDNGYDGLIAKNIIDEGGQGSQNWDETAVQVAATDYVVFDATQIKSATDNIGTFDDTNPDIRYSVDDGSDLTEDDFDRVQAALKGQSRNWSENYLRNELGNEGYERYRKWKKQQAEQQKLESREKAKTRNAEKQAVRKSVKNPVAESKPIRAKQELRQTVLDLFSIPEGSRAELGGMIDSYADRLLKNGTLTEEDRKHFFDRMYDSGVMTVPAEDYFSQGRDILKGGRVYVPESVRIDFGDDWNEIRRRAFGARIYFTSDPNAGGIDAWNHELAEELPGLFDSEETDLRSILERIVEIAEEGQDEKMSLAQYTAMLAQQEYISEDEFLDNMERQMDWALRTFASNARLEISLRDRTGQQIAKERAVHKETAQRQQARKELRELQEKTLKTLRWLNKNRNRAPEELQAAFDEVLSDIDIYAVGTANEMRWSDRYNATWRDLGQMYKDAMKNDPNFLPSKELEMIVGRLDGTKIADMDLGALNDLYKAAVGLRTEFYNRNNVINDEMKRLFAEVYTDAKNEIEHAPGGYSGKVLDKFVNLDQLTPMNVLQRMGGWDPNGAFYSMAKQLEKGERDMRAYSVKAKKMLQEFLTENADWAKKADGQGKDGIWYEVEIPELVALELGKKPQFGATIKVSMTPAQKVHLYLESKNVDNLRHMTGGRTFADKKLYSEGKRQEALAQGRTVRMAPETVKAIVSDLTAEEMELARLLEQYYNSFATGEINRISNILYGYDKAMGKNYAPIYTNKNYTKTEFGVFDQTAEGVGNLKGRQYAVNPSYNISAFDAFERHVDQTARFVGMAIPARNWTTLMNWREKNNSTSDVITHKWGEESKRYITDLITTLQAGDDSKSDTVSAAVSKLQSTYITAIFGANPSIVLKQLGSIPLASAYLDAKNVPTPAQIKNIDRELIGKYTQDLAWRTMGNSTPETRQLKENPNWTQTNKFYKFTFGGGAITAMDGWAASVLWPWAENKVRRDFPELEVGTHEQIEKGESPFYKKVAEIFEDALARSQSTSDEIHQSSLRKSKNPITRAFTMFRSDSAQTYNTLRQKIGEAQYYARTGARPMVQEAAKKAVGAAVVSLLLNAMWAESINFLMALWKNKGKYYRDDEEELTFDSVAGEMVSGMLGSFAGIITGGEEVMEVIGNLLTGEKIYDIETPGIEQLNNLITAVTSAGGSMRDVIAGAVNVAVNGGNVGRYFAQNSGKILGSIKDVAETTVMYIPGLPMSGLPVSNIEGYLLGAVKWLSPELGEVYDNLFRDTDKSDLSGVKGRTLQTRVGQILQSRKVSKSGETAQVLASLYEGGHKAAVPSNTPSSVTVKGEKHTLNEYQKQAYETVWNSIVADGLDALVGSDSFTNANDEGKEKLLNKLYDYAAESAKAELFDGYEMDGGAEAVRSIRNAGLDVAECVAWSAESGELKQADKFRMLRQWDMPEDAKKAVVGTLIGTDLKTESGKDSQYAKMLEALKQGATVDEYLEMRLAGTNVEDFLELVEGGMDDDIAVELLEDMAELDAETEDIPDVTKWRICIDFSNDVEDQLTALFGIMTTAQYQKVEIAHSFGVSPADYVKLQELKPKYDADGNGSFKNAEIKAAVDAMPGNLTKEQKAVLWQLATGSTSTRNNPYSKDVGKKVLEAREATKAKSES